MSVNCVPAAADEEGEAGVGGQRAGLPAGLDEAAVAEVGAAHRVEGEVAVGARCEACAPQTKETSNSSSTARTAIEAATAIAVSKSSGSRPGREPVVHDDRGVAAAGVEVLAHEQGGLAAGGHHLRRRAPVDVAQVVAGDVLAQGVEGQVALADGVGGDALEVAQQAGAERLHRHQVRTDQHLAHRRPHHVAREDADRVAAAGHRRADRDHAAPLGADGERLLVRGAGRQRADAVAVDRPSRPAPRAWSGPGATRRG